jgi:upstream activation factor subunit UAF30
MAKSNTGRSSRATSASKQADQTDSPMQEMMDAVRAHPVAAAAAAVAAGGMVAAGLMRGGRKSKDAAAPKARKSAAKTDGKPRAAGGGLARKVTPDAQLAKIVGSSPLTRAEITKAMWDYIKKNGLQDATNRRMINADGQLRPIFGQDQVSMFEMTRLVNQHVTS